MTKIDAYFHITVLIGGVVLSRINGNPWWFLAAYVTFVCMPSNVLSRRTGDGGTGHDA